MVLSIQSTLKGYKIQQGSSIKRNWSLGLFLLKLLSLYTFCITHVDMKVHNHFYQTMALANSYFVMSRGHSLFTHVELGVLIHMKTYFHYNSNCVKRRKSWYDNVSPKNTNIYIYIVLYYGSKCLLFVVTIFFHLDVSSCRTFGDDNLLKRL
jgi:hypothetical protein